MVINNDKNNKIIKKYDDRKILAIGYYYCVQSDTHSKQIDSCIKAGYGKNYVLKHSANILEIDRFKPSDWLNLHTLLPLCTKRLSSWLSIPSNDVKVKDIREIISLIRLIGDSVGKFIKREMKVEAKLEEKHIYHHFDTKEDEIKYYNELRSIANKQLKEINK